jgi:hypothetical protein
MQINQEKNVELRGKWDVLVLRKRRNVLYVKSGWLGKGATIGKMGGGKC